MTRSQVVVQYIKYFFLEAFYALRFGLLDTPNYVEKLPELLADDKDAYEKIRMLCVVGALAIVPHLNLIAAVETILIALVLLFQFKESNGLGVIYSALALFFGLAAKFYMPILWLFIAVSLLFTVSALTRKLVSTKVLMAELGKVLLIAALNLTFRIA